MHLEREGDRLVQNMNELEFELYRMQMKQTKDILGRWKKSNCVTISNPGLKQDQSWPSTSGSILYFALQIFKCLVSSKKSYHISESYVMTIIDFWKLKGLKTFILFFINSIIAAESIHWRKVLKGEYYWQKQNTFCDEQQNEIAVSWVHYIHPAQSKPDLAGT